MKPNNIEGDLIRDFLDQKKAISEQLLLIDPMAASLRKPAAKRLLHAGLILLMEILAWLLALGCIAFLFVMDKIYPFYLIVQIIHNSVVKGQYSPEDLWAINWMVKGLVLVIALLFMLIANMLGSIRMKNNILHVAGRNMKSLAEQMLARKAAIASLEQRYSAELPTEDDSISVNQQKPHNDILL